MFTVVTTIGRPGGDLRGRHSAALHRPSGLVMCMSAWAAPQRNHTVAAVKNSQSGGAKWVKGVKRYELLVIK